jgi:hypothetical protein
MSSAAISYPLVTYGNRVHSHIGSDTPGSDHLSVFLVTVFITNRQHDLEVRMN